MLVSGGTQTKIPFKSLKRQMEEQKKRILVLDNSGSDFNLPLPSCAAVIQVQASSEPCCLPTMQRCWEDRGNERPVGAHQIIMNINRPS